MKYTEIDSTTAEIKFYGYIGSWWINGKDFDDTIEEIGKRYKNLNVRVHCYGGEVFEGFVIHNALKRSKLVKKFFVDGVAASMMPIVMFAADEIWMAENSFLMFHAPSGGVWGNAKDCFNQGKLLKNMEDIFITGLTKNSKIKRADAEKYIDGSDYWITAKEALDFGIITGVTNGVDPAKIDKPDVGATVETIFGQYAAIMAMPQNNHSQNNSNMTTQDKQNLITKYGLKNVTADSSDTAVLAAVDAVITERDQRINTLQTAAAGSETAQIDAVIASREIVLNCKFTEAQKTKFVALGKAAGVQSLKDMLEEIKPMMKVEDLLTPGSENDKTKNERAAWTMAQWKEKDAAGLEALSKSDKAEDKTLFAKLYKEEFPDAIL